MRRDGFALAGAGVVMMKELADNLSSVRMRLLEGLVFIAGAGAVYATIGEVRSVVSEDPFVFLRLFTTPKAPLPSFVAFSASSSRSSPSRSASTASTASSTIVR